MENKVIRLVANTYLVKIPTSVSQADIYADEEHWAIYHMEILPWQTLDRSKSAPQTIQIMIAIHDFTLDFWHPSYFRQATTSIKEFFKETVRWHVGEGYSKCN